MQDSLLVIIPARGGSKRIPRKNIKQFCGSPMISHVIETCLRSNISSTIMVSTDDVEIRDVATKAGARVPFLRSPENSNDHASTLDVLREVIIQYRSTGAIFENFLCIYPTAALITSDTLLQARDIFLNSQVDFLVSVQKFPCPIQRALQIDKGHLKPYDAANMKMRTQDLGDSYHDAGQFYFGKTDSLFQFDSLFMGNVVPYVLDQMQAQDIDNNEDWKLAEFKYKYLKCSTI